MCGRRGFTLTELMIVIALIGVLLAVTIPKMTSMIRNANEASTKGKLSSIRLALSVYYADHDGAYPADLSPLMEPGSRYLTAMVPLYTVQHGYLRQVDVLPAFDPAADSGNWGYVSSGSDWGRVWVECTHADGRGTTWTSY